MFPNEAGKKFLKSEFTRKSKTVISLLFMSLVAGVIEFLGISLVFPLIYLLVKPEAIHSFRVVEFIMGLFHFKSVTQINIFLIASIGFMILSKNVYMILFNLFLLKKIALWKAEFSSRMATLYLFSDYEFHMKKSPSEILTNVALTPVVFDQYIMQLFHIFVSSCIMMALLSILFYILSTEVLFVVIIITAVIVGMNILMKKFFVQQGEQEHYFYKNRLKLLTQSLGSIVETKIFGKENFYLKHYKEIIQKNYENEQWYNFLSVLPLYVIETSILICVFVLVVYYLHRNEQAHALAVLSLLVALLFRTLPQLNRLLVGLRLLSRSKDTLDILSKEIDDHEKNLFIPDPHATPYKMKEQLNLQNVTFRYPNAEMNTLHGINFEIRKNQYVGITGPSGSGKSTLILLLLGLMDPIQGHVTVDHHPLRDKAFKSRWQKNIGYVPQSVRLIEGSIYSNVAFTEDEQSIDMQQMNRILKQACLEELIEEFGNKKIIEAGTNLSGGQKQRIGIARALYQNPDVLILDEPTVGLDAISERIIFDTLAAYQDQKTIILITHKISALETCDAIHVMDHGKIISSGDYMQLSKECVVFKKLLPPTNEPRVSNKKNVETEEMNLV